MSRSLLFWIGAAVLLFWAVGAYNRLVGLRGALLRSFAAVDEQFRRRHRLLEQLADALDASRAEPDPSLAALRAACTQLDAAFGHARAKPTAAELMTSLKLAEAILGEARQKLPAPGDAAPLHTELAAGDTTLAFAREQFNAKVQAYNDAVRQFPTWLIAGMFGFHRAGTW